MFRAMPVLLRKVLKALETIAPLSLAEPWDNVGLLVEPGHGSSERTVERVLLTIDLTKAVLEEALAADAELVVAYHPPIFHPLKRLVARDLRTRMLLTAIERNILIYSPHTALDAAEGGVNDWLANAVGEGTVEALAPSDIVDRNAELKLIVFVPKEHVEALRTALSREVGAGVIGDYSECSFELNGTGTFFGGEATNPVIGERGKLERVDEVRLELVCKRRALARAAAVIERVHPYEEPAWEVVPLLPKQHSAVGMGRKITLSPAEPLHVIVSRLKSELGMSELLLGAADRHRAGAPIETAAVCAGAGGSLLEKVFDVDLVVTGEMRHHDVLAKLAAGVSVIVCGHTNTERGYLKTLARRLREPFAGDLVVTVSEADRDPLLSV
jgi:dinuclear metal center YbgI/SA1388 family protein